MARRRTVRTSSTSQIDGSGSHATGVVRAQSAPDDPIQEVTRDNFVSLLRERYSADRKAQLVTGRAGIGKSNLLSQFLRSTADASVGFFVGPDEWQATGRRFLADVGAQIASLIGEPSIAKGLDAETLKALFGDLWASFCERARRLDLPHYLVIDGLDQVQKTAAGPSITDLIPRRLPRNVYLLASSQRHVGALFHPIEFDELELPVFGLHETFALMEGLGLEPTRIRQAHEASFGLPAYLAELRRGIRTGRIDLDDLPASLTELLRRDWEAIWASTEHAEEIVALLAFSWAPLTLSEISGVTERDVSSVRSTLSHIPALSVAEEGDSAPEFNSDVHRTFVREALASRRPEIERSLIDYYARNPRSYRSLELLPGLSVSQHDYAGLSRIVTEAHIVQGLSETRDVPLIRQGVIAAATLAEANDDLAGTIFYGLSATVLGTIRRHFDETSGYLKAVASIGRFDDAIGLALRLPLPEERIRALTLVATKMAEAGYEIPEDLAARIDGLVDSVPVGLAADQASTIGAELFAVRPEASIRLIERVTGGSDGGRALDRALALLALKRSKGGHDDEFDPTEQIADEKLRTLVRSRAPGISKLSATAALAQAERLSDPSARLYMVREWCLENRTGPDAHLLISRALDWIVEASAYTPSLRIVRQIVQPLEDAKAEEARPVVEKLITVLGGLQSSPRREAMRLSVFIASQTIRWQRPIGEELLVDALLSLEDTDPELRAFGYALILRVLNSVDPHDALGLRLDIRKNLDLAVELVVAECADQYEVLGRALRTLASVDKVLALGVAESLNTSDNREDAMVGVVRIAAEQAQSNQDVAWLLDVLGKIGDQANIIGPALIDVLRSIKDGNVSIDDPIDQRLALIIAGLPDPQDRAKAWAELASVRARSGRTFRVPAATASAREAALAMDAPWDKASALFELVELLGPNDPPAGAQLIEEALAITTGSSRADQYFGPQLANAVMLGIQSLPTDVHAEDLNELAELARLIPSSYVQAQFIGWIASRALFAGFEGRGRELAAESTARLEAISDGVAGAHATSNLASVIAAHDVEALIEIIQRLSGHAHEHAIQNAVAYLLARQPPDVPVDFARLTKKPTYEDVQIAVRLIGECATDWGFASCVRMLVAPSCQCGRHQACKSPAPDHRESHPTDCGEPPA